MTHKEKNIYSNSFQFKNIFRGLELSLAMDEDVSIHEVLPESVVDSDAHS